jgi:TctA family transporter
MYLGNLLLLVLNLPLIGIWVRLLRTPTSILYPMIVLFCIIGAYSVNNNLFDVGMLFVFGTLGYVLKKLNFELAPLILGFILGPIMEVNAKQALIISEGKLSVFFSTTISTILLLAAAFVIITSLYSGIRGKKRI